MKRDGFCTSFQKVCDVKEKPCQGKTWSRKIACASDDEYLLTSGNVQRNVSAFQAHRSSSGFHVGPPYDAHG